MVFPCSFSDIKPPGLFSVFWPFPIMLSFGWSPPVLQPPSPPTSKSSSLFNNPLVIVPIAPIPIGIIVTFIFHSFPNSLASSRYLSFFTGSLVQWVECSPMIREIWVQSQVASYQRLLKWYLILPSLTLSNIRYVSRLKWSSALPYTCVVAIEKGAFWSLSTTVADNLILLYTFFQFYSVISRDSKVDNFANSLFFFVDYYKVWFASFSYQC